MAGAHPIGRRAIPVVGLAAGLVAASTACGRGPTVAAASLSSEVASALAARFGPPPPPVACPDDRPNRPGTRVSCTARLDGQSLKVTATVTADHRATLTLDDAVIVTAQAEGTLGEDLQGQFGAPVTVACPHHPLLVAPAGSTFTCTARGGGTTRQVTVRVTDDAGDVTYALGTATTTPTLLPPPSAPPTTLTPPPTEPPPSLTPGSAAGQEEGLHPANL